MTQTAARLHGVWAASLAVLSGVVGAVGAGLPLSWAIPALTLAPALVIATLERGAAAHRDAAPTG